jgi:hypothetical protein
MFSDYFPDNNENSINSNKKLVIGLIHYDIKNLINIQTFTNIKNAIMKMLQHTQDS